MLPRPRIPLNGCLIFLCLGATLAAAAEAPYTDNFNSYPNGSVPANFVETTDADWFISGGAYHGLIALFSGDKSISSSLPLTNVAGNNFTVTAKCSIDQRGQGGTRLLDLSIGALGTDPNLNKGQAYLLGYHLTGGENIRERITLAGSINYIPLTTTTDEHIMRLHGGYVDGMLFLTGTVTNSNGSRSIKAVYPASLTGTNFGFAQHVFSGFQRSASLEVAYDEFSVTFESEPVKLANVSTRVNVGEGEQVPIVGFIVTGNSAKRIAIRGLQAGEGDQSLRDPFLELYDSRGRLLAFNDNWRDTQLSEIEMVGLGYIVDKNSALIARLQPGAYTAIVRDRDETARLSLLEVYDLDAGIASRLANLSTRGFVGTGDNAMIAGVIATGDAKAHVVVRALGLSLHAAGIERTLTDPTLELRNASGALVQSNDNWRDTQEAEILATSLAPPNDAEAAIVADLLPTNYTAIVRGRNDTTGVALVEVYHLN